jgi:hypothetical protein
MEAGTSSSVAVRPGATSAVPAVTTKGFVKGDDFAVDDRLIGQGSESLRYGWISQAEIVVVAGAQLDLAAGFDCQCAVAVQLEFVDPIVAIRKLLRA